MSWLDRARRRRPGIYLVRTRKHRHPSRRENGYVGLSNNLEMRRADHLGTGRYGVAAKHWTDLDPVWHWLRLPWWLGWRWCLAPLEYVAIRALLPRYNVIHNLGNPRRVSPARQRLERQARDGHRPSAITARTLAASDLLLRATGSLLILCALLMAARVAWS